MAGCALVAAFLASMGGNTKLFASGALERLDQPSQAPLWKDVEMGAVRVDGIWQFDAVARGVRRWERDDAELRAGVRRRVAQDWVLGAGGSAGLRQVFLPSWMGRAELEANCGAGWILASSLRFSGYENLGVWLPEARVDRYLGPWRMGMGFGFPWAEGLVPGASARVSMGWDYRETVGLSADFSSSRELESEAGVIKDRRALSLATGVYGVVGGGTVLRSSFAWTRLESVHDRLEGRMGLEFRFGE